MTEIKITITAEGLESAISSLAAAIAGMNPQTTVGTTAVNKAPFSGPDVPVSPMSVPTALALNAQTIGTASVTDVPVTVPTNAAPTASVVSAAAVQAPDSADGVSAVPTGAPQYTLEMIATAGSALIDAGKLSALMDLLGKYGISSLTELSPEMYGSMAGDLRALGAAI